MKNFVDSTRDFITEWALNILILLFGTTTLVQAFVAQDPWNAMIHHIARQYPEAFTQAGLADDGASVPNNSLFFRLLVALSADGRWLQFSQTTPR
mgnify:CR=1 FL=1